MSTSKARRDKKQRTRLSPEAREAMIVKVAIEFFAERGFAAQTRDLAAQIGVSEPLLYRYFDSKENLVQRVYEETVLSRWAPEWETLLRDRALPLRERMIIFYISYLDAIDDPMWIRIVMYSSLDGLDLTKRYISRHVDQVMGIISEELRSALGTKEDPYAEIIWHLQSTFIYYLVRKHIHRTPVEHDTHKLVTKIIDAFINGMHSQSGSAHDAEGRDDNVPGVAGVASAGLTEIVPSARES